MNPWSQALQSLWAAGPRRVVPDAAALLSVRGPDAVDFLQRLSSQDVAAIPSGATGPAAFLTPKGKVLALAVIGRIDAGAWIETETALATELAEHLKRYHFREKLTIAREAYTSGALLGPGALARAGLAAGRSRELPGGGVVHATVRAGIEFARWHAPAAFFAGAWPGHDAVPLAPDEAELVRITTGTPKVGVDTDATTLALELPVADHLSTTKGCYTGQEIVARIHTYGHVNRSLVLLAIEGTGPIAAATSLVEPDEGAPVGRVTSAVDLPGGAGRAALGYLPAEFAGAGSRLALAAKTGPAVQVVAFGNP